jgi:hypothetical protein
MTSNLPVVAAPAKAARTTSSDESPGFDERWAAWQAKGAAQDRAFRRQTAFAGPIVLVVAAVVIYAFVGR